MERIRFGSIQDAIPISNLIEHQIKSFQKFIHEGIHQVLSEMFPIVDHNGTYELQYVKCEMGKPSITPEEAKKKNLHVTSKSTSLYMCGYEIFITIKSKLITIISYFSRHFWIRTKMY